MKTECLTCRSGARFEVHNKRGVRIASRPTLGRGSGWRHQIAAALHDGSTTLGVGTESGSLRLWIQEKGNK